MTLGAHAVPPLCGSCPVEDVGRQNLFSVINMEPSPPTFLRRPRVPAERQHLDASTVEFHKVLLKRPDAEDVPNLEFTHHPVRAFRVHVIPSASLIEPRRDAQVRERSIFKIPEDGARAGR